MNGGIIGRRNPLTKGIWTPDDVFYSTNNIRALLPSNAIILQDFESSSGISTYNCSISINTTVFAHGAGSLNIIKGTSSTEAEVYKNSAFLINLTDKIMGVLFYIKDEVTLTKMEYVVLGFGQSTTTRKLQTFLKSGGFLAVGWNLVEKKCSEFETTQGSPTYTSVDYWKLAMATSLSSQVTVAGDFTFDCVYYR